MDEIRLPERCSPSGPRRGFTAVEVVVVLAILGFIAAAGIMIMNRAKANKELDASAATLLALVKAARQTARTAEVATLTLTISTTDSTTYAITYTNQSLGTTLTQTRGTFPRSVAVAAGTGMNPLVFQSNGTVALSGGATSGTITMTSRVTGRRSVMTLTARTGATTETTQ